MSKFLRLIDVLAILILVLFVVSIVTLPRPVNAIIGGVILVGLILIVISDSMAKKKKREAERSAMLRGETGPSLKTSLRRYYDR